MSVYIKGMEMPTSCFQCEFRTKIDPDNLMCSVSQKTFEERFCHFDHRDKDCPLVPAPPHGRLIDADALRASFKESIDECHKWANEVEGGEMYARVSQALGTFVECSLRLKAAPTIIPADKEGEE